jgi:hypothetical protein
MICRRILLLIMIFFIAGPRFLFPQQNELYFYHAYDYGSEYITNPISTILIGGYSIFQIGNQSKRPDGVDYRTGWENVWMNILHPFREIDKFGWKKFISTELIPTSLHPKSAQYIPNYQDHLIGSGMQYRAMCEWYSVHGFPCNRLFAIGTMTAFHLFNEVVENNGYRGNNVDPIADLLVFDPLGMLLFDSDRVSRFFSETLNLRDWSTLPAYDPVHRTLENNSDNYSMKWRITKQNHWSVFYNFGLNGLLGLSYTREDGSCFSGGIGIMAKDRKKVNPEKNDLFLTVDLIWNVGLFYDRNGSLMASLLFSGSRAYKAKINVLPGVIRIAGVSPGFFMAVGERNEFICGMFVKPFPLGLAFQKTG